MDEHWFTSDHAKVMQAAAYLDTTPAYSDQMWASADNPKRAALFLLALLTRERADLWSNDSEREQAAYQAGYGDGLEDGQAAHRD